MELSEGISKMGEGVTGLREALGRIRAGRANPEMVNGVQVETYGSKMPINHVATISTPDPRTIVIQPWDDANVKPLEKALLSSDLGLTPIVDGKLIRLSIPLPTQELREEYVKTMRGEVEETKIAIRGMRHKMMEALDAEAEGGGVSEDDVKRQKDEIEKEVKKIMDEIDEVADVKEKELMTV
jgi:ribosome recycling factor